VATIAAFCRLALGLPQTTEGSHMGHADFRVRSKVFAALRRHFKHPVKKGRGRQPLAVPGGSRACRAGAPAGRLTRSPPPASVITQPRQAPQHRQRQDWQRRLLIRAR
jgi:hypothetical protein